MGIGVKGQSKLVIAGSSRNYLQVGLGGERDYGKALICEVGQLTHMLNSECSRFVEAGSKGLGVSLSSVKRTIKTKDKVPKFTLSVNRKNVHS